MLDGLKAVYAGLLTIIEGIKMGIEFLINLVTSTLELLKLLATTVINTNTLIITLPEWLIAVATCTLGISVLYLILGRESGK